MYPAYDLNHAYEDTDVYVSMAKLKEHDTCGITLSCKNVFGTIPASIYGDDAGVDEPNESPTTGRLKVGHEGVRQPAKSAPQELRFGANHDPGYRVPHIVADLVAARPIHLAIIDGVETIAGGEGPWIRGVRIVRPGVLLAGLNPVCTDAVGAAVMGYNPRATRGTAPFQKCDNILQLAEAHGVGTTDLSGSTSAASHRAGDVQVPGVGSMTHATGTFEVKLTPQPTDDPALGRMTIDKQFHGDLEGDEQGRDAERGDGRQGLGGLRRDRARDGNARTAAAGTFRPAAQRHDDTRDAAAERHRRARFRHGALAGLEGDDDPDRRREALVRVRVLAA